MANRENKSKIAVFACLCAALAAPVVASCATVSPFHAVDVPEGSLRVAQVVYVVTRKEVLDSRTSGPEAPGWSLYEAMTESGIKDSEIKDGSLAFARVYCCGGPSEREPIAFYVPEHLQTGVGDIVEIRSGPVVDADSPLRSPPNTATRVREKAGTVNRSCRWLPDNESLWGRVIYCDWMEAEGWVKEGGSIIKVWIKTN